MDAETAYRLLLQKPESWKARDDHSREWTWFKIGWDQRWLCESMSDEQVTETLARHFAR
jgi:hypothetical protein